MQRKAMTRRERAEAGELLRCSNCGQRQEAMAFGWRPGCTSFPSWCSSCYRETRRPALRAKAAERRRLGLVPPRKRPPQTADYLASERWRVIHARNSARDRLKKAEASGAPEARLARIRATVARWEAAFAGLPGGNPRMRRNRAAMAARLVEANDAMAKWAANSFRRLGARIGLEWDDLYQFGRVGLVKGANAYEPARRKKFSTVAGNYARNAIKTALRDSGGYVGLRHVPEARVEVRPVDPSEFAFVAREASDPGPPSDAPERVAELLARLPDRERDVLVLRFGLGGVPRLTVAETAARLGVGDTCAREAERKAIRRLQVAAGRAIA